MVKGIEPKATISQRRRSFNHWGDEADTIGVVFDCAGTNNADKTSRKNKIINFFIPFT